MSSNPLIEKFFQFMFTRNKSYKNWFRYVQKGLKKFEKKLHIQKLKPEGKHTNQDVHEYKLRYNEFTYVLTIINIKWNSIFRAEGPIVYIVRLGNGRVNRRLIQYDSHYVLHSRQCDLNLPFPNDIKNKMRSYYSLCKQNYATETKIYAYFKKQFPNFDYNNDIRIRTNNPSFKIISSTQHKASMSITPEIIIHSYLKKKIKFVKAPDTMYRVTYDSNTITIPVGLTGTVLINPRLNN